MGELQKRELRYHQPQLQYIDARVSITSLNLANCQQVTDIGVRAIAAGCPGITSLNLARYRQVNDVGVQAIGAGCPNLTSFDL